MTQSVADIWRIPISFQQKYLGVLANAGTAEGRPMMMRRRVRNQTLFHKLAWRENA